MWNPTDVLYAMFILKANHVAYKTIFEGRDEDDLVNTAQWLYADIFADRGVAEEEFEGWVDDDCREEFFMDIYCEGFNYSLSPIEKNSFENKIKFRFVDDE